MPPYRIRPIDPERDYAAASALVNAVFPEYPESEADWREGDRMHNPKLARERFVAEGEGGELLGFGMLSQNEGMFHPQKFFLEVLVHPEHRRRGVGRALFRTLVGEAAARDPIAFWASVREDLPEGLAFVAAEGFREVLRTWENHLRMADFEPGRWDGRVQAAQDQGIRLVTLTELRAEDPQFMARLFDLVDEIHMDVPSADPPTHLEREAFERRMATNSHLLPDGYFLAADGDRLVGMSTLFSSTGGDFYYTGLTGVRRSHRGRGIALALKLAALDYARAQGIGLIKTWNDSRNTGMLAINEALGFRRQPAWIQFVREPAAG